MHIAISEMNKGVSSMPHSNISYLVSLRDPLEGLGRSAGNQKQVFSSEYPAATASCMRFKVLFYVLLRPQ
jgi:hypothetical protein